MRFAAPFLQGCIVVARMYPPGFAVYIALKRMVILLLVLAAFFGYLAVDAFSMGKPARNVPYEIEANARRENLDGISLAEQRERQAWQRSYGIGKPSDIVWLWTVLAGTSFASALVVAYQ